MHLFLLSLLVLSLAFFIIMTISMIDRLFMSLCFYVFGLFVSSFSSFSLFFYRTDILLLAFLRHEEEEVSWV